MKQEKDFVLVWKDGKREKVTGSDISNAFSKAGYGVGAIRALDYYEPVDRKKYKNRETDKRV